MSELKFSLSEIVMKIIGSVNAYGDTRYDEEVLQNLKPSLPELCQVVADVFGTMSREYSRYEASMKEIGTLKLKWAKEIAEMLKDYISDCGEGANQ